MNFNKDNFQHHPYRNFSTFMLKKVLETMAHFQDQGSHLKISLKCMRELLSELLSQDATVVKAATINSFDELCDDDFEKLLSHFSDLEALSMEGSCLISDDYLKIIGRRLKQLRTLKIEMNTSITDTGLRYLSGENELSEEVSCPLLENLDIKKASGITDAGILSITSRLQQLRHLALWINEVNQNVVQRIASQECRV